MLRITAVINSSRTCRTLNLPNPKPAELHALGLVNGHEADDMGAGRVVLPRYIGTVGNLAMFSRRRFRLRLCGSASCTSIINTVGTH